MPTAQEYLRPELIAAVERLDLRAKFIVEGYLSGLNRSPFHGASVEFSEHRRYSPGDEPRLIDQNVLARTDRLYIRKFQAETNLEAWLAVDCSTSMNYPPRGSAPDSFGKRLSKLDYAITLSAALAWLMIGQQDAVGLAAFDSAVRAWLPPRSTRRHFATLLSTLASVIPPPGALAGTSQPQGAGQAMGTRSQADPTGGEQEAGLADTLHRMARQIRRRGLIIVISDLLADPEPVLAALQHLHYRGHDLVVFQVLDVCESRFELDGLYRLTDPETGAQENVEAAAVRSAYLSALQELTEKYRTALARLHADFMFLDTATAFDSALTGFLRARSQEG